MKSVGGFTTRLLLLAAGALVLAGGAADAQTVIQNSNSSIGSLAVSGPAVATNVAVTNAGPTATSLLGGAQASQIGNNNVIVNQSSTAKSGDALAGSQVTGVVGGGPTVVQNQNSAIGAVALSGPAVSGNFVAGGAGPRATAVIGFAGAQQFGDNTTVVSQDSVAISGDALAGSQSTGVVGGFGSVVQNSNSCLGCLALSGPAFSANVAFVNTGPSAFALLGVANTSQFGSNTTVLEQSSVVASGDALAGSQVTGVVGGFGANHIGGSNFGLFGFAASGLVAGGNAAFGGSGPTSGSLLGFAGTSQAGDNFETLAQTFDAASGDALSGSQVSGLVAQERDRLAVVSKEGADVPAILND